VCYFFFSDKTLPEINKFIGIFLFIVAIPAFIVITFILQCVSDPHRRTTTLAVVALIKDINYGLVTIIGIVHFFKIPNKQFS
jgi:hypothetical protein